MRKLKEKPEKCGKKVDCFGEVQFDFDFAGDEESDSEASSSSCLNSDEESDGFGDNFGARSEYMG